MLRNRVARTYCVVAGALFPRLMNTRLRTEMLSDVVAGRRFVVRLLHGLGRIVVVGVDRHYGHLRRTVKKNKND